jgi:hypothetical protein
LRKALQILALVLAVPVAVLVFYLLQTYPLLRSFGDSANTVASAMVYVLTERLVERIFGGGSMTAEQIAEIGKSQAKELYRLQEQSKSKEQLNLQKRAHHQGLVGSYFEKLCLLRIRYYPNSPFRLYLDASVGSAPNDPRTNIDELPNIPEARQHLQATEYESIRSKLDRINSLVDSFNEEARKELDGLDLEGKISRQFPKLKAVDSYFPRGQYSEFYYPSHFMKALEITARSGQATSVITRWEDDFMPKTSGTNVLWLNGIEVARSGSNEDLNKFEPILKEGAPAFASLVVKRDKILNDTELQLSLRTAVDGMLEDYRIRRWLFGRCKVEDVLEEEESRRLSDALGS